MIERNEIDTLTLETITENRGKNINNVRKEDEKKKIMEKAIGEICAYARGTTTKQYYLVYNTARAIHIRFQSQIC